VGINDVGREDLTSYDRGLEGLDIIKTRPILSHLLANHSEVVSLGVNLFRFLSSYQRGLNHREIILPDLEHVNPAKAQPQKNQLKKQHETYLTLFKRRLDKLVKLARFQGIEPVLITQPALYGEGIDPETGVNLATINVGNNISGQSAWRTLELYNDVTRQLGQEQNIAVIDLAREMPKDSRYYYDYAHFTNEGAEKVGKIVYRDLSPFLASRNPSFLEAAGH
jgi:lysophospholipase L1-like esterase